MIRFTRVKKDEKSGNFKEKTLNRTFFISRLRYLFGSSLRKNASLSLSKFFIALFQEISIKIVCKFHNKFQFISHILQFILRLAQNE